MRTIVAQATPAGISGLSIIRVSGDKSFEIADKCFQGKKQIIKAKSHTILYGNFISNGVVIDDVTASIFHSPHSYTGENTVEFGVHGGSIIPMQIVQALIDAGCKYAESGEFTKYAFMNGRINLVQAEAVADIIHSISIPSATISVRQLRGCITEQLIELRNKLLEIASLLVLEMDFSDEDIPLIDANTLRNHLIYAISLCNELTNSYKSANILRNGYQIVIIGKPNSGKSTLFNKLLKQERAIVSDIPGTTRDYISETIILNEIPIKLIDTAGLRETDDIIEINGIKLATNAIERANLILLLNAINEGKDASSGLLNEVAKQYPNNEILLLQNKCDMLSVVPSEQSEIFISAATGLGVDELLDIIFSKAKEATIQTNDILLNERQYYKLIETATSLSASINLLEESQPNELIAIEISNSGRLLGELVGETWNEEVLNNIFSKFCIGK